MNDLLSIADLDAASLRKLLDRADAFRRAGRVRQPILDGRSVALLFEKPSTRTRVSFEVAVARLGAHPVVLSAAESQLGRGETIADTGRTLSRYVDAIVWRTYGQDRLETMAEAADVPVINALSDLEHPCQALADLATMRWKLGPLDAVTLAYVGDGNNVVHSLLLAAALSGMELRCVTPPGFAPDPVIVARATTLAAEHGGPAPVVTTDLAAIDGVDAIYTDVWTSMGAEAETEARRAAFADYQVNAALVARAPDAVILHCLPAHRGEEITDEVIDSPRSLVWDQAEHRLHAQCAVLEALIR